MSKIENGAIDYRARLRNRNAPQAAPVQNTPNLYDPPTVPGDVVDAEEELPPEVALPEPVQLPVDSPQVRTQQDIRSQAKAEVVTLLGMTDADYTVAMTKMSADDPMLFAAVVDEINNARAEADNTTV